MAAHARVRRKFHRILIHLSCRKISVTHSVVVMVKNPEPCWGCRWLDDDLRFKNAAVILSRFCHAHLGAIWEHPPKNAAATLLRWTDGMKLSLPIRVMPIISISVFELRNCGGGIRYGATAVGQPSPNTRLPKRMNIVFRFCFFWSKFRIWNSCYIQLMMLIEKNRPSYTTELVENEYSEDPSYAW